ncbi:hypothetical protein [Urbifossiella limnaea]|uniref:DUF5658 domain-containing protein n=1 Tax=Urbifossiella limnaea TaxID=2528023 RepID=A0A517XLE7_9BACT|nr:hypothetical protein [Urbifossiella limnaea]QDU18328.1 hypothetical protein ETAA1_02130 [Urbifossiella limnaea]
MRSRLWLLAPAAALYAGDVALTLAGQPAQYWGGEYGSALEANPVAYPLLARGPWLFVASAVGWFAVLSAVVVTWRRPFAGWVAVVVAAAHAVGGACWLARIGPWGLVAAVGYLAAGAQASTWCWCRHAKS